MASWVNDFPPKYIAEVNKSWTPLGTWGVPLHILDAMVGQRGLLAAFSSKTHVLGGLGLIFEENGLCEARYVSKIGKVHTPRIQQIVFLKGWHLSCTLSQRFMKPFPNNLSKTAAIPAILLQKCGGAQAIRLGGRLQNWFSPDKMRWVDRKNHILYKIDRNNPKTLPGNDGNNVPGISYLKPRKKFLALRQA